MKKLIACLFGLFITLPAMSATLPSGYTELEYLESSGTQYIDTGYKKSQVTDVNARLSVVRFSGTFQLLYGLANDVQCAINSTGQWLNYGGTASTSASLNVWYNTKLDYTNRNLYIDGTPVATGNTGNNSGNILVFNNTTYKTYIRVSSVEIHDLNGNIVASFVPARRVSDGVLGMYDLADSNSATAFHTNAGTGTFIAGPTIIPNTFEKLQYIESTGTQYINTGVNPSNATGIDFKFRFTTDLSNPRILGEREANSGISTAFRFSLNGGRIYLQVDGKDIGSQSGPAAQVGTDYVVTYAGNASTQYFVNNTPYSTDATPSSSWTSSTPIYLFGASDAGTMYPNSLRYYYVKIYNNNTPVQDLVPVKRLSDGEVGMFDTVTGAFLTNSGTGDFVAGPSAAIKIATNKFTNAAFSDVVTGLNTAISTIKDVVANTISQTSAIANLQSGKQTKPADAACPAGKKCLLVEDSSGVPHWYEIVESYYNPTLPVGYTELAYLESTGTQYIDTGFTPNQDSAMMLRVLIPESSTGAGSFGGAYDGAWRPGFGLYGGNTTYSMNMTYGNTDTNIVSTPKYEANVMYDVSLNKNVASVTNVATQAVYSLTADAETFTIPHTIELFRVNIATPRYGMFRLYYAKIYNNGTLVRDFVPARRESDGVLGMYDLANGQFYTNAGTGTFTAGPVVLPAGFTTLDYVNMAAGSYLLTNIVPVYNGHYELDFTAKTLPSGSVYFLGGRTETYGGLFLVRSGSGTSFVVDAFGNATGDRYTSSVTPTANTRYKFTFNNKVATLESGGSTLFTKNFTVTNANGAALAINGLNNNGTVSGGQTSIYVYSFKTWNSSGNLVANYVPAQYGNTVGFYDTVTGDFKTATSGTFTGGTPAQ